MPPGASPFGWEPPSSRYGSSIRGTTASGCTSGARSSGYLLIVLGTVLLIVGGRALLSF